MKPATEQALGQGWRLSVSGMSARAAADWLAVGVAVSLPWSTSVTSILIFGWMLAVAFTLRLPALRELGRSLPALAPVLLWGLALVGMLWATVAWGEALHGLRGFHKLLLIPLLLYHFERSERAFAVVVAFAASVGALLVYSWGSYWWPVLVWQGKTYGVPVKDYIYQGLVFTLAICGLIYAAAEAVRRRRYGWAAACLAAIALFLANLAEVALSRSTAVVLVALCILVGLHLWGKRGALVMTAAVVAVGALAWFASPMVQARLGQIVSGALGYAAGESNSETQRLEFWRKSIGFMREAPALGHGTGSIPQVFARSAEGASGPAAIASANPHNQVFTVGIQLGLAGVGLLLLMWASHFGMFTGGSWAHRLGQVVVAQNVLMSLFNSSISDFTSGWIYVFGVGVLGGAIRRAAREGRAP